MIRVQAPAKINVFLRILRRRPDGYHELRTLFERIDLRDELRIRPHVSDLIVTCSDPSIPSGEGNLVYRAAALLRRRGKVRAGARIHIIKRIPSGAGLGGGSSDAAAALTCLNRFWKLGFTQSQLLRIGARVGSDVPFFILGVPWAAASGRGEKLRGIPAGRRKIWHCVVKPPFEISTKDAYQAFRAPSLTPPSPNVRILRRAILEGDPHRLAGLLTNSLEATLNKRVRSILTIKRQLLRLGALGSLMSGSGSCVFGIYDSEKAARRAAARLGRDKRLKVYVASTY